MNNNSIKEDSDKILSCLSKPIFNDISVYFFKAFVFSYNNKKEIRNNKK